MATYQELLIAQYVKKLEKIEKEKYVLFHFQNYQLDAESAQSFVQIGNAKYAAIAGYYAMLNCTLWYFAKYFSLKISEEEVGVHTNCLIILQHFVKDTVLKNRITTLLEEAKLEYLSFTILKKEKENTLPLLLQQGADKRKKYTYYSSGKTLPDNTQQLQEATQFIENTVKPYLSILEKLTC